MLSPASRWTNGSEVYRFAGAADLAGIQEMLADPEVGRWLWFTPLPPSEVEAFFTPYFEAHEAALSEGRLPESSVFAVSDPAGRFLGQGAVVAVAGSPGNYEIGFQLCQHAWGRGVGTRLSRFLVAFAVTQYDAFRVQGSCLEGNVASRKLLEGVGLLYEGRRTGYRLKEGHRHDELEFGALAAELSTELMETATKEVGLTTDPSGSEPHRGDPS